MTTCKQFIVATKYNVMCADANASIAKSEMMQTTAQSGDVRETHSLIASDKVEGTPVRRSDGEKIGTIERVMIEKRFP